MAALPPGVLAPDFKLPTMDGTEFSLTEALRTGPVILAFFKISCPVCQYAFPLYERLARQLKGTGVGVIGVSQDSLEDTASFMREFGITFTVALDDTTSYKVSNGYGLTNVPTMFEISPDGQVEATVVGWSRSDVEALHRKYVNADDALTVPLFQASERLENFKAG
ncbi:MAG TPA: TlpA disulfide reductase family protein [Clostridia bacterium]|nr:TlpA disulfide reductase family protein [Clostridia bacterium]